MYNDAFAFTKAGLHDDRTGDFVADINNPLLISSGVLLQEHGAPITGRNNRRCGHDYRALDRPRLKDYRREHTGLQPAVAIWDDATDGDRSFIRIDGRGNAILNPRLNWML